MALTAEQISTLAARKGAKSIAVSNFLGSLFDMRESDAHANLQQDAASYRWNAATQNAIRAGLKLHYKK